ncbi:natterin-4-like isoform X2 [Anopheles nili]|nr:natterin-4-like isoform X2 [Anopheles nili]
MSNPSDLSYDPTEPAPVADFFRRKSSSSSNSSHSTPFPAIVKSHVDVTKPNDIAGCWQYCNTNGPFPTNMVRAGIDTDGEVIYVGRAFHEGDMIPAKVIPTKNLAFVCHGGEEVPKEDFEVLRYGAFVWEFSSKGAVPETAIKIGQTAEGEPLYMGRAIYQGSQTPGKVHSSHGCCYIPFDGAEVSVEDYEVLCVR